MKKLPENQNTEYKESWRDEYLKWICGFANAQGGTLYIGIDDDGNVCGVEDYGKLMEDIPNKISSTLGIVCDVNLLENNGIKYIEIVAQPSNVPISYHGVFHYRSGATKQELQGPALQNFLFKKLGLSWDNIGNEYAALDDIDREAVNYFLRHAIDFGRMNPEAMNDSTEKILENMNLYDDEHHIKNAALLLFGKNPAKFFSLCDYRIGRFGVSKADLMFQDVIEGDLIRMCDKIINILRSKYLISPIHYEGLVRKEPLEIPEPALREAILNAIIHKDYTGAHIQMRVWNDRIEIWNQGSLPENWTVENLMQEHSSRPRNNNIALAFYKAGFIENWGRGIDKICEGLKEAGLKPPVYEYTCGGVQTTIFRKESFVSSENTEFGLKDTNGNQTVTEKRTTNQTIKRTINRITKRTVNSLDEQLLSILKENPNATYAVLSEYTGKKRTAISTHLKKLVSEKLITRVGSNKSGYWKVIGSEDNIGIPTLNQTENPTIDKNQTVNQTVNPLDEKILSILRENPNATYAVLSECTGKKRATISLHLKKLAGENLIVRVGSDKNGYWKVIEN